MLEQKIPKIIHFCWFGGKEKPRKVQKCIDTWHRYLSDYEFIEWNENNFDINSNKYVKQAYEHQKFAYVSDYARIKALYEYGGIYMDTDVEVHKSFNDLLEHKCIFGFEEKNYIATSFMACVPKHEFIKTFVDIYENINFCDSDNKIDLTTNVEKLTSILEDRGLIRNNKFQSIGDIKVYPQEYFSPYDYGNCIRKNTKNTYCEHYFLVSWMPWTVKVKKLIKKIVIPIIGINNMDRFREINNKR